MKNILLVYPEFTATFWNWKGLLKFVSKKAALPPLGLLTVAAMLPKLWKKKLVNLNIRKLTNEEIKWADYVFVSAMATQSDSAKEVVSRCEKLGAPIVLGGPILEMGYEVFGGVSHFLWGETENTLPEFISDLQAGTAKRVYPAKNFPDMDTCPIPLWELINPKDYVGMLVQYGRGCPFKCTFCNVADINGRIPRAKSPEQFLQELDAIHKTGFRGLIMLADDNFIGNKKKAKEMLQKLMMWQQDRGYPFYFNAEVDITIADDDSLMDLFVSAGFKKVFLGLESPNMQTLLEWDKLQNVYHNGEPRDLAACVEKIQKHGLIPMSGFILGGDNDDPNVIFDQHVKFYRETGIVFPMVGVLQAPQKTKLFAKLQKEGRLLDAASGNNTDRYPNFIPKMPIETLAQGYVDLMKIIYSPKEYYRRIRVFLGKYNASSKVSRGMCIADIKAFVRSVWCIGLFGGPKTSYYYWKTLILALLKNPGAFAEAVALQIYRVHFWKVVKSQTF